MGFEKDGVTTILFRKKLIGKVKTTVFYIQFNSINSFNSMQLITYSENLIISGMLFREHLIMKAPYIFAFINRF